MKFFMAMDPPTVTYQEKQIAIRNGKPIVYDKPEVAQARTKLRAHLHGRRRRLLRLRGTDDRYLFGRWEVMT